MTESSVHELVAVARAWRNGERSGIDLIAAIDAHDAGIVRRQATPATAAADSAKQGRRHPCLTPTDT